MATKKQAPKPARKAPALRKPDMAPIDAVRNPNFDAAMAQQDYFNNLSRLVADRNARGSDYNLMPIGGSRISAAEMQNLSPERRMALEQRMGVQQGGLGGQQSTNPMAGYMPVDPNTNMPSLMPIGGLGQRPPPMNGGFGYSTYEEAGIPPEQAKILDSEMAKMKKDIATQDAEWKNMKKSGKFVPIGQSMAGPVYRTMAGTLLSNGIPINIRKPQFNPAQNAGNIQDSFDQYAQSMQQNPVMNQMADYDKMLQQGMQRNQDMNQAAQNFAGMGGPQKSFSQVAGGIGRLNRSPKKPRPNSISPSNQKLI